jgi:uncharacterized membrane protein
MDSQADPKPGGRRRDGRDATGPDGVGEAGVALRRALDEFLGIPILLVAGSIGLSVLTYLLDAAELDAIQGIRSFMTEHVFADAQATSSLLAAIATSVVTVTSITFSLLLIAVQQSASTLSTQVFDQFMQRRANQVFFGYFLGVGLLALLTLATVTADFNPVIGGTVVLVLTIIALMMIPLVIYSTLDQMRPPEIITSIRSHGLAARERQRPFLARTRRRPVAPGAGTPIHSSRTGFVAQVDLDAIDRVLERMSPDAEVEILRSTGAFVAFGDSVATIRGAVDLPTNDLSAIEAAIRLDRERDLRLDPAQALAQLETIGWTTTSSSKQNPHGGLLVVFHLQDLIARWAREPSQTTADAPEPANGQKVSAVVYRDGLLDEAIETLASMTVVASEGMQHQVAAAAYRAFARTYAHLPAEQRRTAATSIERSLTALADHVPTLELEGALRELVSILRSSGTLTTAAAVETATDALLASSGRVSSRGNRPG